MPTPSSLIGLQVAQCVTYLSHDSLDVIQREIGADVVVRLRELCGWWMGP